MPQTHTTRSRTGMWLGLLAALFHAIGYVVYGWDVWHNAVHTNPISWFLWVIGTAVSYLIIRDIAKDWAISLLNAVCAVGMTIVFGLVCYKIYESGLPVTTTFDLVTDVPIALLDLVTMGVWIKYRNTNLKIVNLVFQTDLFLSFVPIALATVEDPTAETFFPWAIWTAAYLIQVFCVVCRANDSNRESIDSPLHYFAWHLFMAVAIISGTAALS